MQAKEYKPTVVTLLPPRMALFVLHAQPTAAGLVTGVVVGSPSLAVVCVSASKTIGGPEACPPASIPITATDNSLQQTH